MRYLVFIQAGKFFFSLKILQLVFFLLLVGHGQVQTEGSDLCLRRFTCSNQLLEAVLGCPGRNMKNELYVLKKKKNVFLSSL